METLVTRPIEEELNTDPEIKELTSTSVEGYSSMVAEFETTVDLERRSRRCGRRWTWPGPSCLGRRGARASWSSTSPSSHHAGEPLGRVRAGAPEGHRGEDLQDRLEQIPSVLRVDLRGGLEREVKVDVDLAKLKYYGSRSATWSTPSGTRTSTSPAAPSTWDASSTWCGWTASSRIPAHRGPGGQDHDDGRPVYVRDVATVDFGFEERESFARLDGTRCHARHRQASGREHHRDRRRGAPAIAEDGGPLSAHHGGEDHLGPVGGHPRDGE
jgi:multidrug efflux pump